jgi:hypothetical protein
MERLRARLTGRVAPERVKTGPGEAGDAHAVATPANREAAE